MSASAPREAFQATASLTSVGPAPTIAHRALHCAPCVPNSGVRLRWTDPETRGVHAGRRRRRRPSSPVPRPRLPPRAGPPGSAPRAPRAAGLQGCRLFRGPALRSTAPPAASVDQLSSGRFVTLPYRETQLSGPLCFRPARVGRGCYLDHAAERQPPSLRRGQAASRRAYLPRDDEQVAGWRPPSFRVGGGGGRSTWLLVLGT